MKNLFLSLFGLTVLVSVLHGGEQSLAVTPQTLEGWTITKGEKAALAQSAVLSLPAGAQLARDFDADRVVVKLSTLLNFGSAAEDFATVEVGPAALVFSRDRTAGQVFLVVGDNQPYLLPIAVEVNDAGKSVGPVELQLAYERSAGGVVISTSGQTWRYTANPSTGSVEVVISAGARDAMPLQSLAVNLIGPDSVTGNSPQGLGNSNPAILASSTGPILAGRSPTAQFGAGGSDSAAGDSVSKGKSRAATRSATLEVFTPSAVHHGRVDAIRAVVAQGKKP